MNFLSKTGRTKTYSKTALGTRSQDDRLARTGKSAPEDEPTRMMKIEATRSRIRSSGAGIRLQSSSSSDIRCRMMGGGNQKPGMREMANLNLLHKGCGRTASRRIGMESHDWSMTFFPFHVRQGEYPRSHTYADHPDWLLNLSCTTCPR